MDLSGNTVLIFLITGGASGIGYAMAEAFLDAGSEVLICGRREQKLLEAQERHPELHVRTCDVANDQQRTSLVEWTLSHFGGLNVLVNNAGVQRDISFTKGIGEYLAGDSEIRINLEAPILLAGMLVPHLAGKKGAAIINISSGLGFVPMVKMPAYCATKAGVHAFTMCLRRQVASLGIRVFEVVPPGVDTELNPQGREARGGYKANLTAKEFVGTVMKGFANDVFEIGFGMTEGMLKASRADMDKAFQQMNPRS